MVTFNRNYSPELDVNASIGALPLAPDGPSHIPLRLNLSRKSADAAH